MQVREFDHSNMQTKHTIHTGLVDGWYKTWSGAYSNKKFHSSIHTASSAPPMMPVNTDPNSRIDPGTVDSFDETMFEDFCELSILERISKKTITMMELGAGAGNQSIDVSAMVKWRLCDTQVESVQCYAVEAEATHFRWLQENFKFNDLSGHTIFGAMSDELTWMPFDNKRPPADSYGQALGCPGMHVPVFTVDYFVDLFELECIDILHMDVQGEESKVISGCAKSIEAGKIDYIIECPHTLEIGEDIKKKLDPYYDCIVDMPTWSGLHNLGLTKPVNIPQDGLQFFVRKELNV